MKMSIRQLKSLIKSVIAEAKQGEGLVGKEITLDQALQFFPEAKEEIAETMQEMQEMANEDSDEPVEYSYKIVEDSGEYTLLARQCVRNEQGQLEPVWGEAGAWVTIYPQSDGEDVWYGD
jgi:hypothetical protein